MITREEISKPFNAEMLRVLSEISKLIKSITPDEPYPRPYHVSDKLKQNAGCDLQPIE